MFILKKRAATLPEGWAPSRVQALLLPICRLQQLPSADNMFVKQLCLFPSFPCMGRSQLASAEGSSSEVVAVSSLSVLQFLKNAEELGFRELDFRH